jgi:hypothetical protein
VFAQASGWAQNRNLTVPVLVNSQNTSGYNPSSSNPGEFQRFAERYLTHLQVPYEIFDVATISPPADLNSRQLIIAGHSRLLLPVAWRNAIATAVNAGTGFVNLDSDAGIGNESHIQAIFGATGSTLGTAATQISVPPAVAPNGATPHYIAAMQKKFDDPNLVYPFHAGADGVVRSATSTLLTNATGTVIARLGNDPLILVKTYGTGRAVHFGTLDYLHADRFGFLMGVDDLFWRSLVWAARKPFVLRGYPRLWAVQMDDDKPGWGSRVNDLFDTNLTGVKNADGTGGPWKVTGYVFTDNVAPGSADRGSVIANINAGNLEVSPHSFGDALFGNMYWNSSSGQLTDQQWLTNMAAIDTWKQGSGGADAIPSLSRSVIGHYWDLSDNIGYDLWNHFGFRYVTSIQKPGFQAAAQNNGAERIPARSFWVHEMPPKTPVNPNYTTENFPLFFADDYQIRSRSGLPAQNFFLFTTQYTDIERYGRIDYTWPGAFSTTQTVAGSISQLQQYTWRHWSSFGPVQLFTHDSLNYEAATPSDRQSVITQTSSWLNTNGVRHVFMDDLGDYIYARTKSTLTRAAFDGAQITYTFTGTGANADGNPIPTRVAIFQGDDEGLWQTVPGFTNGLTIALSTTATLTLTNVSPSTGQQSQTLNVTLTGTNFLSGATCSFGAGITVSSCAFTSASQLVANISISGTANIGTRNVIVTNPDGQSVTLANAFTVTQAPAAIHMDFNYTDRASFLNAGWSFIATTAAGGTRNTEQTGPLAVSYDQGAHPGVLRVPLGSGENWQNLNNSQNTLFYTPPTDWTSFVVKIAAFNPTANYQQVGLQAYQNDDNYVDANRAFVNGSRIEMFREVGQSTTYMSTVLLTNTGNLLLRMDRSGNTYSGFYSTNSGSTWISLGTTTMTLANPKLAIMAGANDAGTTPVVDLAWAEIFRSGTTPAPTIATVNPAAGTQGQTLNVIITGNNFQTGAVCSFGSDVTVNSCAFNSITQLTANITVAGSATTGARNVTVTNSDAQSGTLPNAFTVNVGSTPAVTSVSPISGASGVSPAVPVSATFSLAMNPATVTNSTFRLLDSSSNPVPASVAYNASTFTATLTPSSSLIAGASYQAVITGGSSGVKSSAGNPMASNFSWAFTTAQPIVCPCYIWQSSAIPSVVDSGDAAAVELGVRFRSDVNGYITGLRFYKAAANTGTHAGHLWTNSGTLLATATFTSETASGWQQVTFPSAIAVTAGTTYVASYFAPNGHYSRNANGFTSAGIDNAPLHLLRDGLDGSNGVYAYGSTTTFPNSTYQSTNYWVDVIFDTSVATPVPTVTSVSPSSGSSSVSTATSVSATFSLAMNPTTITGSTFRLLDSSNNPVPASVSYNASTFTATLTPSSALTAGASYQAVITGGSSGVKDTSGNPMASNYAWLFTTTQPIICPCSMWPGAVTPSIVASGDTAAVELGVRFRSDVTGYITGLRFYKGSPNTGVHVGNLWSNSGTLLASATFTGETASGWQQVTFASPVAVTAGTTYVASYFAPNGNYSMDLDYFASVAADNAPLHFLRDGVDGANGVYLYSTTSAFPTSSFRSSNYWVDVVFDTNAASTAALASVSLNPTSVQGGSSSTGTVTLTAAAPAGGATVLLSSSNTTAASAPANVTIPAGATTATFTISTSTVSSSTAVTISGSYQGQQTATLTVTPAAVVSVSNLTLNPTSVISGATSTGTITLSSPAPPSTGAVVALSSDKTSAATVPATVTIAAGATTGTFTITTLSVSTSTPVTISASYNGVKTAALTVNPAPSSISALSLSPVSVVSGTNSTATVTLVNNAPAGGAVISLTSADTNVATTPASVTVAAGTKSATFTVATSGVSTNSTVAISATYAGSSRSANLTVLPAALSSVSISPTTVIGGVSSTGTVTLSGTAPTAGAVVTLSSTNTAASKPASVTVPAGQTTATFTITTVPVSAIVTGTISGTYLGVTRASATLTVNPPALSALALNPASVQGGSSSTGTVTLTGVAATNITIATASNRSGVNVPSNVVVPAGAQNANFTITTIPVSTNTTASISATYRGVTRSATLAVQAPQLASITLNPTSVPFGGTSTGTATLTGPAPATGTSVSLSSSNRFVASVPNNAIVPAGQTSVTFLVQGLLVGTATITGNNNPLTSAKLTVRFN